MAAKRLNYAILVIMISIIMLSGLIYGRKFPTSPLLDEEAEQVVLKKLETVAKFKEELQQPAQAYKARDWKLRSLWVSVIGKDLSKVVAGKAAGNAVISSNRTFDQAREVPAGPNPIHHSGQPSSP